MASKKYLQNFSRNSPKAVTVKSKTEMGLRGNVVRMGIKWNPLNAMPNEEPSYYA
jgi:hypothetical protein